MKSTWASGHRLWAPDGRGAKSSEKPNDLKLTSGNAAIENFKTKLNLAEGNAAITNSETNHKTYTIVGLGELLNTQKKAPFHFLQF